MGTRRYFLFVVILAIAAPCWAQESLGALLDRGFVAQWLVCGPFRSDLEGGIVAAAGTGRAPLGDVDFMQPLGGIARIKPNHLDKVKPPDAPQGEPAIWQRAKAVNETLDLAPFFPNSSEGVAYAAFYAISERNVSAYVDVQTLLGARIWLNGFPVRDIRPASVVNGGVDRFMADFRQGSNLMILEIPGAAFDALAPVAGLDVDALRARVLQTRPLLTGSSGFQFALRIKAVRPLGSIAYLPRIESTGGFSERDGQLYQAAELTLYNPTSAASAPVNVEVQTPAAPEPLQHEVPPLSPESQEVVTLAIPTGSTDAGQAVRVDVTIETEGRRDTFATSINALPPPKGGHTYVVTGAFHRTGIPEDQSARIERRLAETNRQLALIDAEPDYGFALGATEEWRPFWESQPAQRKRLKQAIDHLQCAADAGADTLDERIVDGELLIRNLAYGYYTANPLLGHVGLSYIPWRAPAVAPQTPQILDRAGIRGIVSSLPSPGIPEVFEQCAPNGARALHRRKVPSRGPASVEELKDHVFTQRAEMLERGFNSDVLICESAMSPPEPFYLGACADLKRSVPSIRVTGSGGIQFLEEARGFINRGSAYAPPVTAPLNRARPGELLAQPDMKQAHAAVENMLTTAEKLATFASLLGATYPGLSLDHAWRQLLYLGSPERAGFCRSAQDYVDALAAYREASERAQHVLQRAASYIAEQTDTFHDVPVRLPGAFAIVVFNPSSWDRTDVCDVELDLERWRGLKVFGPSGAAVPFALEETRAAEGALVYARVRFVAKDVPSLGYKTYYVGPDDNLPRPQTSTAPSIENDFFRIIVNPSKGGDIVSLVDVATGAEYVTDSMNEVVALAEDAAKNSAGRELWAAPPSATPSPWPAEVNATIWPGIQRLHISVPMGDGVLERELTLYEGVPRVDCTVKLRKVSVDNRLVAATFHMAPEGRVPVFGERFGALVGSPSLTTLDFRTAGARNVSGCGVQPSQRWLAVSPNDRIEAGLDTTVPLLPPLVVYGDASNLDNAAKRVQEAFLRRATPCIVMPDTPRALSPSWTDSTEFQDFEAPLFNGAGMRIVLGGPGQNAFAKRLFTTLSETDIGRFEAQLNEGAHLFYLDDKVKGLPPIPTLIVGGYAPEHTERLAQALADAVEVHGVIPIAPLAYAPTEHRGKAETGLAILHPGATVASVEHDGTLLLGLCHDSQWEQKGAVDAPAVTDTQVFRYALYPFAGTWRDAQTPRAAHSFNEPLIGVATGLHLGPQPTEQHFIQTSSASFIVTAVKPAGYDAAVMKQTPPTSRNGIEIRGYESLGIPGQVSLRFCAPIRSASSTTPLGVPVASLSVSENDVSFDCGAFGIETLTLLPGAALQQGQEAQLGVTVDPYGPVPTRYWQGNPGAAPLGGLPLSLYISGDLKPDDATITVTVANNTQDRSAAGIVALNVPEGWKLAPARFDYDLPPGHFVEQKIVVLRTVGTSPDGGVVATTDFDGRTYRDVLTQGANAFALDVRREGNEVRVLVKNNTPLHAEGFLDIIAPAAWWPELAQGGAATDRFGHVFPRRAAVSIPPYRDQRILFRISGDPPPPWLAVKLAANGALVYQRVPE